MEESRSEPWLIAIGASAGGLDALQRLFSAMPTDLDAGFVVVQHLSPNFKSLMDELLQRITTMRVVKAEQGQRLEGGHVYLMPPRERLCVRQGVLHSLEPTTERPLYPITEFLVHAAEEYGGRVIAIILSGTGTDGAEGVQAVRDAGGLVLVQDPETARFDGMPRAALDTGAAHLQLPPEDMGRIIRGFVGGEHAPELVHDLWEVPSIRRVLELLRRDTRVDFTRYKPGTIQRRIHRRMQLLGIEDPEGYVDRLQGDPAELSQLWRDLLIGVTGFFRDAEAFELLRSRVLPELLDELGEREELRIWVAGCATGEEAYSVAMAAVEAFEARDLVPRVKVFATDVQREALHHASVARYPAEAAAAVPEHLARRFLVPEGPKVAIAPSLRKRIVFAPHDVVQHAPFTRLDLVTCRNLLIYLQPSAQRRVLGMLHFALRRGGILFLGPSEAPAGLQPEFDVLERRWRFYRKKRDINLTGQLGAVAPLIRTRRDIPSTPEERALARARDRLVDRFAPPTMLLSPAFELMHTFNGAGRLLPQGDGPPSLNVLELLPAELRLALGGTGKRALRSGDIRRYEPLDLPESVSASAVVVESIDHDGDNILLVTFEQAEGRAVVQGNEQVPEKLDDLARDRVLELERELQQTRVSLQATAEEMEASNEELQAANEELVASNEELHSTNEELQSVNEELYTVNSEYQAKIAELSQLTADMDHMLASTQVHTLFLDDELRIRKFTPDIAQVFHFLEADVGRRVEHFSHRLRVDDLRAYLVRALRGDETELRVEDVDGHPYLLRILPYCPGPSSEQTEGVVLTLIDVRAVEQVRADLRQQRSILGSILENSPAPIAFKDLGGRVVFASRSAERMVALESDGLTVEDRRALDTGQTQQQELPVGSRHYRAVRFPVDDGQGGVLGVASVAMDVTEARRASQRDRDALDLRDRFLATMSHELRNPLNASLHASRLLRRSQSEEDRERALGVVERQLQHMARLVDDLLDVARISRGKIQLASEEVDVVEVARQVIDDQRAEASGRGIELVLEATRPLFLHGDEHRLLQVFDNLVVNAVKFTPGGGRVTCRCRADGDCAVVEVQDTGTGMSADELDRIFEPFFQIGPHGTDGGMGVGLSLVQAMVGLHGGTVSAHSAGRGLGSTFVVRLPGLLDAPSERPDRVRETPVVAPHSVLVVDDNDDVRSMLRLLLQTYGHRVLEAGSAREAIERLHALPGQIDLALVDVGMPGMSGHDLARWIRGNLTEAPYLVALTGFGTERDRLESIEAGFDEHLVKPLQPEALEALFRRILDEPEAQPRPAAR